MFYVKNTWNLKSDKMHEECLKIFLNGDYLAIVQDIKWSLRHLLKIQNLEGWNEERAI